MISQHRVMYQEGIGDSRRAMRCLVALCLFIPCGMVCADQLDYPIAIHRGNGLANVFARLNSGQSATIAYIGGSITEGWGYRNLTTAWFESHYPGKITEINAGWSGTGSLIGTMRFQRDVLAHHPDLVFVEFAVNDLPEDPLVFVERNSEGFMRQAWMEDPDIDLCFVETIAWYSEAPYLAGYYPTPVQAHYNACDHYGCPSVNVGWALYEHVLAGTPWTDLASDRVHPNSSGSQIYADALTAYLESERTRGGVFASHAMPLPMTDYAVTGGNIIELASINPLPAGWVAHYGEFGLPSHVESTTAGAVLTIPFEGPATALKVIASATNDISFSIDNGPYTSGNLLHLDPPYVWSLPATKTLSFGSHTLAVRVDTPTVRLVNLEAAVSQVPGPGPTDTNLALNVTAADADSSFGPEWGPENAADALTSTKWTSAGTAGEHWLAWDLGTTSLVSTFIIRHASDGGEWSAYNTEAFSIETGQSLTGPWTVDFTVHNASQLGTTLLIHDDPRPARFVRLHITDPGIDHYARIPEFEVWGYVPAAKGDLDLDGDVDQADFGRLQACYTGQGYPQTDPACEDALLDGDSDVDINDFSVLQACFSGPGIPADTGCGHE